LGKFDKVNLKIEEVETHSELQRYKKPGRPKGTFKKGEVANASITISLTPSQKKDLEEAARKQARSVSSLIKYLLVKEGIIKYN
jgi:hypothetical protein